MNENLECIEKRYKGFRWGQYIALVLSVISCIVPVAVAAITVVPAMEATESKLAFTGVGAFILAIVILVVLKGFVGKYVAKLPFTLTVLISVLAMLLLTVCLKRIIDDAIAILIVAVIGSAAGFVLEMVSAYCRAMAEEYKERFKRGGF